MGGIFFSLFNELWRLALTIHCWFLEPWNKQKSIIHIWQRFSCLLDKWIAKILKEKKRWLFEKIHIIRFEMCMDRPDKSENIFWIWYYFLEFLCNCIKSWTKVCNTVHTSCSLEGLPHYLLLFFLNKALCKTNTYRLMVCW